MDASHDTVREHIDDDTFDIVLLHSADSDTAFALLYRRHARAVLRYAWHLARTESEALDLVQETFATLWDKRTSARIVDESVLPWLLTVCRNHGLHLERSRRRHATVPLDVLNERAADNTEVGDWMTDVLSGLTKVDRMLCELCLVDNFTYREAARLLELTETAVGKRLERARTKLRKLVVEND
jgi:RNA polymerase sigma factor (sigma-70 family)